MCILREAKLLIFFFGLKILLDIRYKFKLHNIIENPSPQNKYKSICEKVTTRIGMLVSVSQQNKPRIIIDHITKFRETNAVNGTGQANMG